MPPLSLTEPCKFIQLHFIYIKIYAILMKHCEIPSNKVLRPASFKCNVYSIAVQTT